MNKNELIEKYENKIKERDGPIYSMVSEWLEDLKHLQELPQQEVYRIYIQGVPRCSCCNSSLIAAEIFCTGCGAKIKRID